MRYNRATIIAGAICEAVLFESLIEMGNNPGVNFINLLHTMSYFHFNKNSSLIYFGLKYGEAYTTNPS